MAARLSLRSCGKLRAEDILASALIKRHTLLSSFSDQSKIVIARHELVAQQPEDEQHISRVRGILSKSRLAWNIMFLMLDKLGVG